MVIVRLLSPIFFERCCLIDIMPGAPACRYVARVISPSHAPSMLLFSGEMVAATQVTRCERYTRTKIAENARIYTNEMKLHKPYVLDLMLYVAFHTVDLEMCPCSSKLP